MLQISWDGIQAEIVRRRRMSDIRRRGAAAALEDRRAYNLQVRLPHPDLPAVRKALVEVTEQNQGGPVRRRILGIGGNFLSGKSTIAEDLCVELCEAAWARYGTEVCDDYARHRVQPIFFANAAGTGEGDLMRSIAESLGLPEAPQRSTAQQMLLRSIAQSQRSLTTHGWIDDVNALSSSSRRTYLAQFGKKLLSDFPVTFVMIGKGLRQTPFFSPQTSSRVEEDAAEQLRERLRYYEVRTIPFTGNGPREFARLVLRASECLLLTADKPLSGFDAEDLARLHKATGGRPGKLFDRMTVAASRAVGEAETLTPEALGQVHAELGDAPG